MKPTKCPAKEKNEARKAKKEGGWGGEKAKSKSQDCCVTFKPLEILLSSHARTSQANILHVDQKAAKCTNCEWLYGTF